MNNGRKNWHSELSPKRGTGADESVYGSYDSKLDAIPRRGNVLFNIQIFFLYCAEGAYIRVTQILIFLFVRSSSFVVRGTPLPKTHFFQNCKHSNIPKIDEKPLVTLFLETCHYPKWVKTCWKNKNADSRTKPKTPQKMFVTWSKKWAGRREVEFSFEKTKIFFQITTRIRPKKGVCQPTKSEVVVEKWNFRSKK